jgi:hypothetical protein
MKQILFSIGLIMLFACNSFSQQLIAVQKPDTTLFFTNLDTAMIYAANGDYLYLPGGSFAVAGGTLQINKLLNIFGAGHYPDSTMATGQTIINGNVTLLSGASGGSMQGLYINGFVRFGTGAADRTINGYSISRCGIVGAVYLAEHPTVMNPLTQNIYLSENVFYDYVCFTNATNLLVTKNIFNSYISSTNGQVTFINNNFLHGSGNCVTHLFHNINGANFSNNIMLKTTECYNIYGGSFSGNFFYNNMFQANVTFPWAGNLGSGNIINVAPDSMFVNAGQAPFLFDYSKDFHLKPSCPGVNAGTDMTEIGIYGTALPYKEGAVPVNPHIQFQYISPTTDTQGNLNVNIRVSAQSR